MMKLNRGAGDEHPKWLQVKLQNLKVAAREKGLCCHLYHKLAIIFHTFTIAFKMEVGPLDSYGFGFVLMGDEEQANFIDKIVAGSRADEILHKNILGAYNGLMNLKVSPKAAHSAVYEDFLYAVQDLCANLSLHEIGNRIQSA